MHRDGPISEPTRAAVSALAPMGTLRAGINMSNFLLVSDKLADGTPVGVSPDLARALAQRLGVALDLRPYKNPGDVADAATSGEWDIANIGADPARSEHIEFTAAYAEIESTYLVPAGSTLTTFADVDQPGIRIAAKARSAYALWLERNLRHGELVETDTIDASFDMFVDERLDALAGLRPRLLSDVERLPGARILDGRFFAVQQAIGTPRTRDRAGVEYLATFVEEAKVTGLVARFIEHRGAAGLTVAPLQDDSGAAGP